MAKTNLNMQLLLRRDLEFNKSYVLAAGEPGFEINTNTLKIGDGSTTWENLPIANYGLDDNYKRIQEAIAVAETNKNVFVYGVSQNANGEITVHTKEVDFSDYRTAAAQDLIDATFKTRQDAYSAEGSTVKTVTKVEQDENGVVEVTFEDIAFPAVPSITITDDAEAEIPETETVNVYKNLTADGHALTEELVQVATAKGVQAVKDYVGNIPTDAEGEPLADSVVEYINKKTDGIATDENLTLLGNRVTGAEGRLDAIQDEETGILAQAKAYTDAEDIFVTDMLTVDKFGGIAGGANLNGKTTHQILTDLLYPYVKFIINSSSRNAAAATLECGQSQTLSSATISVTKKKDPITSIKLFNGSTLLEEKTGDAVANGGSITFNGFDAITVTKDNNPNLKFTVTDGTSSEDKSVGASTFVYPYYWGVCAEDATINEDLIESLTKSISGKGTKTDISFTCAQQKIVFAYPKAHGALKSIIDPNNFETIDGYARSEVSITGLDGSAQAYYVYVQKDACTVTGFKVDFKY